MRTPKEYSFEKGINTEQDYDAAIALISELHETNKKYEDVGLANSMLMLSVMIEKYERQRYLIFYNGYTC